MSQSRGYGTMSSSGPGGGDSAAQQSAEIIRLSDRVATNISTIKNQTAAIQRTTKAIGTPQDNVEFRKAAIDSQKSNELKIQSATADLATLSRLVRTDSKQRRLLTEKLTADFQVVVKNYKENLDKLVTKIRKTILITEYEQNNEPESGTNAQLLQQQQQMQIQLQLDDSRMRELQMREIESVVVNVNAMMLDLSTQITDQGQFVATIESNIEHAEANIEQGVGELRTAATYQNKYRKKVLILLLIAIIVGVIITSVVISDFMKN